MHFNHVELYIMDSGGVTGYKRVNNVTLSSTGIINFSLTIAVDLDLPLLVVNYYYKNQFTRHNLVKSLRIFSTKCFTKKKNTGHTDLCMHSKAAMHCCQIGVHSIRAG